MKSLEIEELLLKLSKQIFSYTLRKCKTLEDSEDLAQEIITKAYKALTINDSIIDKERYIWTIAHNSLVNYYKDKQNTFYGYIEDINLIKDEENSNNNDEHILKLQQEIAYLSKTRRQIIIKYYYENKKQETISNELNIPLGTIKWHLFEAKKELKEGISKMRKASELKFNPVEFRFIGLSGTCGSIDPGEFFRSSLSQNICYSTYYTPKTINEIAEDLGVSPVYIESEIEYLEKYDFLRNVNNKYLVNFLIKEPTSKTLELLDKLYKETTKDFSIELFNNLMNSKLLDNENLICNKLDELGNRNYNYILWSLIPYIITNSYTPLNEEKIKFEEVATHRLDGSYAYFSVDVLNSDLVYPKDYVTMDDWCGPMWNGLNGNILFEIKTKYNKENFNGFTYQNDALKILELFIREYNGNVLSIDEYTFLAEKGYIKIQGNPDKLFYSSWQNVIINSKSLHKQLLDIGTSLYIKYQDLFNKYKAEYLKHILKTTPKHLRKMYEYETQHLFSANGLFIHHVLVNLMNNNLLKLPNEDESKLLISLILTNNDN